MKNKIISILLTILLLHSPVLAFIWDKPLPKIDAQSKVMYVNIDWWNNFSDPYLKEYIIKAIVNNHSAKQASWRVEEYRQNVKMQFSQELPSLSLGANYILSHFAGVLKTGNNLFAVPFLMNYEADLFLKNHDKTKSSKKAYESTIYQEMSIYISLTSDVAATYINILKYDKQIELKKKYVQSKQEELKRENLRYSRGVTSIPKLNEIEKSYELAKNELNNLTKNRDIALNQLALLIGESPENAKCLKRNSWDNFVYKSKIPSSISSDVIFSRPDVLAAEENLEKASIDVRVARKELLPSINITGLYAFSNVGDNSFASWNSTLAALIAGATVDLFKGGQKIAKIKAYKAKYEQLFEAYKQTDLQAIKEVNDSLLIVKEDSKTAANTAKSLKLQQDNYNRSLNSYNNGVISYSALLVEQEKLLNAKQDDVSSKAACYVDYITLYKAVGGKL